MATLDGPLDYSDDRPAFYGVDITLMVLAAISVILRLWSRKLTRLGFWWDDYLMIFSFFAHTGAVAVIMVAADRGGLGRDVRIVLPEQPDALEWLLKMLYVAMFFYGAGSSSVKLGVLAFYWRLFPTRLVRNGCYVLGFMCIGWGLAIEITNLNLCRPIQKFWNDAVPGDCSVNFVTYFLGNSCANLVIDGLTLALPIRETLRLQISPWRKWGLVGVFMLGGVAFAACLLRVVTLSILQAQGLTNPTKQVTLSTIATGAEIYVAIIGACMPTFVPVYRKLRGGDPLEKSSRNDGAASYNNGPAGYARGQGPDSNHHLQTFGKGSSRPRLVGHDDDEGGSFESLPGDDGFVPPGYSGVVKGAAVTGGAGRNTSGVRTATMAVRRSQDGDSNSSRKTDELPLRSIKVTRDVVWTENRRQNV